MSAPSGWVDTSRSGPPPSEVHIDADLARSLVAAQARDLAGESLGERFDGWDMAVFRLGEHHALRLPRTEPAVTSLAVETRALQELGQGWTFPHPRIVRLGEPTEHYPWPWAITTWIDGDTADARPLDVSAGAEVGAALAQVHTPAPADARPNPEQSLGMAQRADHFAWAWGEVAGSAGPEGQRLDASAVAALWRAAMGAAEPGVRVWSHADGHGANLLTRDGAFAGIIDWGKMAPCDRAVDLGFL